MAYNIVADFFSIINVSLFDTASILLVACFIIWELPRSVKLMSEEYTHGLYPEGGRVVDFALFAIGLASVMYITAGNNAATVVSFLKTPGITAFFLVVMAVVPLIILLGYLKRFFARTEGNSIAVFLAQGFLDLMHTLFQISLAVLVVPVLGYLLFGGMVG